MSTVGRRWTCPECQARLTAMGATVQQALTMLQEDVAWHLREQHPDSAGLTNAAAQAGGWPGAAGHRAHLWGGPEDGAELWLPPGAVPDVIGVTRTAAGRLALIQSATARLMNGVHTYRAGSPEAAQAAGRPIRYLYDGQGR